MKVSIKTLQQVIYDIEIESDEITIKELKDEIERLHNFDSRQLKLLYKGAVLDDSKTIKEYDIQEGNYIFMHNIKTKLKNVPLPDKKEEEKKEEPEYEEKVAKLLDMGMGFELEKIQKAIKIAKGDLDLAMGYCMEGIPEELDNPKKLNNTDSFKKIASVAKCICRDNLSALGPLLQNLGDSDPKLLDLIRERGEDFKKIIMSPVDAEDLRILEEYSEEIGISDLNKKSSKGSGSNPGKSLVVHSGGNTGANQGSSSSSNQTNKVNQGGNSGANQGNNNSNQVNNRGNDNQENQKNNLTEADKEAIKRILALCENFKEEDVIETYLLYEKNEDMAAGSLFEKYGF